MADSEPHTKYTEERLHPIGEGLRRLRNARIARRENRATKRRFRLWQQMIRALLFELHDPRIYSLTGSYISNGLLRVHHPCIGLEKRTGNYRVGEDVLPLYPVGPDSVNLEGWLLGITVEDMAVAIADNAETQANAGKHWTVVGSLEDDTPARNHLSPADVNQ